MIRPVWDAYSHFRLLGTYQSLNKAQACVARRVVNLDASMGHLVARRTPRQDSRPVRAWPVPRR